MNIIFKNWLDINRESSSESLSSEENSKNKIDSVEDIGDKILMLKRELENAEKINSNLKKTINELDKKINKLVILNKSYKDMIQIILFFSVVCNVYLCLKLKS